MGAMSARRDRRLKAQNGLTPKQRDFLEWLVTPQGYRQPSSQAAWCKEHAVAPETVSAWKRDLGFRTAWDARLHELRVNPESVDEVMAAMHLSAKNGDVRAAKLWLEAVGRFHQKVEVVDSRDALKELSDEELDELAALAAADELAARREAQAG